MVYRQLSSKNRDFPIFHSFVQLPEGCSSPPFRGLGEGHEGLCNEIQLHTRAQRCHHAQAQLLEVGPSSALCKPRENSDSELENHNV